MTYKTIPATNYSPARRVAARTRLYTVQSDGSINMPLTGRSMDAETFETYKQAAALDGITTKQVQPRIKI